MKKLYLILLFVHIISSGISAHVCKKAELTFPRRVVMEEFTGTSAIETIVATQPADGKTYNLQGQQVTCPDSKGIYIRNGKKHLTI